MDGAGAASADAASEFRSPHIENVTEHPKKRHIRGHIDCFRLPVDFECVGHNVSISLEWGSNRRYKSALRLAGRHSPEIDVTGNHATSRLLLGHSTTPSTQRESH